MTWTPEAIVAIITAIGSVLIALKTRSDVKAKAKKDEASAAERISAASISMITPLQERLEASEAEIADFRKRLKEMRDELEVLEKDLTECQAVAKKLWYQVKSLGGVPVCELPSCMKENGDDEEF